ncbi:2-hydroxyacid dehydrogenase [Azospirillum thiophilum]|uniref:2-hydroxyacid dehydrogenase n=1 Tax=Azospirillum thiophilum TaxID=528244 RepID=A0AAC8VVB0_9PROT|nr:virulence RhuM family protein [Azospirillum thiophilum]ALG70122.1 2-hydroxyacid dehydrogenase [Azospirillum thiophilum]KJR66197.1 2-hydroxyacid dehydrogenase [Azospirillum thiophilum]
MSEGEVILYRTDDGSAQFRLTKLDGTVWMNQIEIAELYQTSKQAISHHIRNILAEGEVAAEATVKDNLTVQTEGRRQVSRSIKLYRLDMILAVGYRVRSPRGVQFRQWATATLAEYLVKGFVMNDERLKNPGGWDYFDELLERIRDIRASEKRFYQKIRDLFALSQDYRDDHGAAALFFAEVQNKLLHAVTGHTAAELVVDRSDPGKPNMNLQSWTGARVRKADVIVAKNYLAAGEITELNRIVTMFLDYAEDRVSQRKHLTLDDWRAYVDRFITFNERPLLNGNGRISHDAMKRIAHDRYDEFDRQRKQQDAIAADAADLEELKSIEAQVSKTLKGGGR